MQKAQTSQPSNSNSQSQQQSGMQMNRTVQGVAAALYGILRRTHELELPKSSVTTFDPLYNIFESRKLVSRHPATIQEHLKAQQPDFVRIYKFIYSLFRRAQIEPECLIAAVVYFEEFFQSATPERLLFTSLNWERIVFTCLMIASKAWDDVSCSTKSFAVCSNGTITLSELCTMERIILQHLDYKLYLTSDTYRVVYYDLKKYWINMSVDEKGVIIPKEQSFVDSLGIPERWGPHYVFFCLDYSSPSSHLKSSLTQSTSFSNSNNDRKHSGENSTSSKALKINPSSLSDSEKDKNSLSDNKKNEEINILSSSSTSNSQNSEGVLFNNEIKGFETATTIPTVAPLAIATSTSVITDGVGVNPVPIKVGGSSKH